MKRIGFGLLFAAAGAVAQLPPPSSTAGMEATRTASLTWTAVGGEASDLSVGADGSVFAVDPQGRVWLRRPGENASWINLPGDFRRIAAATEKSAWAIDADGGIYAWNGTWWRPMGERFPGGAVDIAVSANGVVFAASKKGKLLELDARRGLLTLENTPTGIMRVAVDDLDRPWVIDTAGSVHRFASGRWTSLPRLRAADLSVANGGIWLIAAGDHQLVSLETEGSAPRPTTIRAAIAASAPGGLPWIATADGRIYANNPNTAPRRTSPGTEREQVFTQLINWQRVNGSARQLAISPGGAVLALGRSGEVWLWKSRNNWGRLPGSFTRIALDKDNTPWGISTDGRIMRYQGSYWTEQPGSARDLAGGTDGSLWIVQRDGNLARWQARQRIWEAIAPAVDVRRMAIGPDTHPWIIDAAGVVQRHDGKQWIALPEIDAADIAIGPEGSVFVAGANQRLSRWDANGKRWERLNGEAATVAVGPAGKPWIATEDARILASAFFDELPDSRVNTVSVASANATASNAKLGLGDMAATASASSIVGHPAAGGGAPKGRKDEPLNYRKVTGTARRIAIGADGSVFVVTYDGGLARWSNTRNAFVAFPGQFARIAVAPDGKPWGISTKSEVFRHDGSDWKWIRNVAAQEIAIGYDGTVIVVDMQKYLQKYDPAADAFTRIPPGADGVPPTGVKVAVDPAGKPWTITDDGFVVRCDKASCERLPVKARSLDVGPEGSIVIVDADRMLRRWNDRSGTFDRLDGISDLIELAAVGPRGKPWLLSTASEVWASEFFSRDESRDATTTAVTAAIVASQSSTGTTTPPAFTFLVTMPFDKVSTMTWVANSGAHQIAIRPAGGVTIVDENLDFWNYNETTKTITKDSGVSAPPLGGLEPMRSFLIGKDGTYWVSSTWATRRIWRRQGSTWVEVPGNWTADSVPITIAEGPDGSIYASGPDSQLYRYDTSQKRFVKVTLPLPNGAITSVAVDPNGRFWVTSESGTAGIYEYVGNTWIRRMDNSSGIGNQCRNNNFACVAIGANGSVYSIDTTSASPRRLMRWNAASGTWEKVTSSPSIESGGVYVIGSDGRPWVVQVVSSGNGQGLYRAR